jgi:MFS transporter, DHA1 family, multidrug resistance protein
MTQYFQVSAEQVNLTLILFFVFFAARMLFLGPLSDRHGRRPILLVGLSIYSLAGFCAAAPPGYQSAHLL